MQTIIEKIRTLFNDYSKDEIVEIEKLPQAGSERQYFRIHSNNKTYIATYGSNIKENETFIYFSNTFKELDLATANIILVNEERNIYLQEDFGNLSLLNVLESEGFSERVYNLYKKSLNALAKLQIKADEAIDYSQTLTNTIFGKQAIMADLLYFKYYFLDALQYPYDKQLLLDDFEALSSYLSHTQYRFFMFRDFQSRNIMVTDANEVRFIDYQGGMKGAPQYDAASLLWQAKAELSAEWKYKLLDDYIDSLETQIGENINKEVFKNQYNGYVLIRMLQVLGAYGFRGLFERKAHFLTSIPFALQNLKLYLEKESIGLLLPEFDKVLQICISDEIIKKFTNTKASSASKLLIKINSFSYIQNGYPKDDTKNGGGFVFDCRGILNPGRKDEYKKLSGEDKPVKDFLENETKMTAFLNSVYNIVDISVEDYLKRDFESLMINFGCTGGQHRSVYAANALARHLKNKFGVQIITNHLNKENWKTS